MPHASGHVVAGGSVMKIADTFHECRIWLARRAVNAAMASGEPEVVIRYRWDHLVALINARSPSQVERMETRMGLR